MADKGYVLALGTFDGIHKGHLSVLNAALNLKELVPAVVTFDEPPKRHTTGNFVPMLMSFEQRAEQLEKMGFAEIFVLEYDKVHNLTPQEFLDMLFEKYNVKAIVCGFNYRFGKGGIGDVAFLSSYCYNHGAETIVCPETVFSGQTICSTLIRNLIADGNISFANMLLLMPFGFKTEVVHGQKRGRTMGFPTINQKLDGNLVMPKFGVYASVVFFDGKEYPAVTNIGIRPTFELQTPMSETYIVGFDGDLYGKKVTVKLLEYLREEQKFDNLEALQSAIMSDSDKAVAEFNKYKA